MRKLWLLAAVCAVLLLVSEARGRVGWERDGDRDGVSVDVADAPGSKVPTVRATVRIQAPTDRVWEVLSGPAMKFDGLKVRAPIGPCGERCQFVYFRMGNWMITDRHYVVRMQWREERRDAGTAYVGAWRLAPEMQPPDGEAVGIRDIRGSWRLEPADGGRATQATYTNHLDLGGSVPAGLYSLGFVRNAYDVLAQIRSGAERPPAPADAAGD